MVEVHDDPEHAASDGAQTITPAAFKPMVDQCRRIAEAADRTMWHTPWLSWSPAFRRHRNRVRQAG